VRISGGRSEQGIVFGNAYDKYGSRNPVVRALMRGFTRALEAFVDRAAPASIHEVGCGEGYWGLRWARRGVGYRGTDVSATAIGLARRNARSAGLDPEMFSVRSVYDLTAAEDVAELIVCCEVLEHLENPRRALGTLAAVAQRHLILSVPREPLWRVLNLLRGAYWAHWGNTPGHRQHWSQPGFVDLVSAAATGFEVIDSCAPVPWTMLLCRRRAERGDDGGGRDLV
jgi:SAM-dependent methyltransferase